MEVGDIDQLKGRVTSRFSELECPLCRGFADPTGTCAANDDGEMQHDDVLPEKQDGRSPPISGARAFKLPFSQLAGVS